MNNYNDDHDVDADNEEDRGGVVQERGNRVIMNVTNNSNNNNDNNHVSDDTPEDDLQHYLPAASGGDSATDADNHSNNNDSNNDDNNNNGKNRKRLCRFPGCTKVIKSQGHCQRHGAKAKRCKVEGCGKQAQGTHDGMCKRHWKASRQPPPTEHSSSESAAFGEEPPLPEGESVYEGILPQSISYKPAQAGKAALLSTNNNNSTDPPQLPPPRGVSVMPLVAFLAEGADDKEPGWHRNAERRARGLFPVHTLAAQLEPWERQLALVEILLLSGGTPYANFQQLAHAWGRDKGFHNLLAMNVCERRGEVERKKRSDARPTNTSSSSSNSKKRSREQRADDADVHHHHHHDGMPPPSNHNNNNNNYSGMPGDTANV